jgi:NTE family protein
MSRLIRKYKKIMAQATSYEMWEEAAFELDYLEGNVEWKETLVSDLYNYELIYDRLMHLREYGDHKEYGQLIRALREGLHHDLGNIGNQLLYNQSHIGTKHLIEEYVNQVCKSLNFICEQDIPELPLAKKNYDFSKIYN